MWRIENGHEICETNSVPVQRSSSHPNLRRNSHSFGVPLPAPFASSLNADVEVTMIRLRCPPPTFVGDSRARGGPNLICIYFEKVHSVAPYAPVLIIVSGTGWSLTSNASLAQLDILSPPVVNGGARLTPELCAKASRWLARHVPEAQCEQRRSDVVQRVDVTTSRRHNESTSQRVDVKQ
jgi:hypothetical protein